MELERSRNVAVKPTTKVSELLAEHPSLLEFLTGYAPEFRRLANPLLRATLGRVATLEMAARMGNVPLDRFLSDIDAAIAREGGGGASSGSPAGEEGPPSREDPPPGRTREGEDRKEVLLGILRDLHAGKDPLGLQRRFDALAAEVSPGEIGALEQQLVQEGTSPEEIRRLCDLHVGVFRRSLDRQAATTSSGEAGSLPGGDHPLATMAAENRLLQRANARLRAALDRLGPDHSGATARFPEVTEELRAALTDLAGVEIHYRRKENQLFPYLERHGLTAPPQVMWAVHDDIRASLKAVRAAAEAGDVAVLAGRGRELVQAVEDMIYKEERILFPMSLHVLTAAEWEEMRRGDAEIGYAFGREPSAPGGEGGMDGTEAGQEGAGVAGIAGPATTDGRRGEGGRRAVEERAGAGGAMVPPADGTVSATGRLPLDTGALDLEQIDLLLNHLPVDISFVDENDEVRYYSRGKERIFPRSPGVIGRKVQLCHPPKSLAKVEQILAAFRAGTHDHADFWVQSHGRFLLIRYFAVRDASGRYRGALEVTQDITAIRTLQGERRLLDWDDRREDAR